MCSVFRIRCRIVALLFGGWVTLACRVPVRGGEREVLEQLTVAQQTWTTVESWQERRQVLRDEFLKAAQLWPLPSRRPSVPVLRHSYREYAGYSVENVALETLPGFFCTGNLYQPIGRHDRGPIILCPHGHFRPWGRMRDEHQIRCAQFARMGATVLSYGMVGWNDSIQTTHDDPYVLALQTWNSLRAVDFMTTLPRVDTQRIAVTGASGGGTQSIYLALVDDRVKVVAPLVIVYPWAAPEGCRCEGGLPVMSVAKTNAIEIAAALSPRPQLLISVGNDPTQHFPQVGFPFIKHMYGVAGVPGLVENLHLPDEGHDYGPSKRQAVYAFFQQHLGLAPDRFTGKDAHEQSDRAFHLEDLQKIVTEDPAQLAVFDANYPLPPDALRGSEAISKALQNFLGELRKIVPSPAVRWQDQPAVVDEPRELGVADEVLIFTPPGWDRAGERRAATGPEIGHIAIRVRDRTSGQLTACRINVVGADGNYYEPATHPLQDYTLSGTWPRAGWGNRPGKAPSRYLGHGFYSAGTAQLDVPAGPVRIEVWKGFEFQPERHTAYVPSGGSREVEIQLQRTISDLDYVAGDPHLHLERQNEADQSRIFDLMEAEGIQVASVLAYNEPAGPYQGFMDTQDSPQGFGLGQRSIARRGPSAILSGQEYRSSTYGHLNLFGVDHLIHQGEAYNADDWPPFGHVARDVRAQGGIAFYAHGGYAQEIYADVAQGHIDGVELLQFGIYRGIGLHDWYNLLNVGFRVPASGACDYPACRHLGDCKTYVELKDHSPQPDCWAWHRATAEGRSFVTSGPLLLLEVDGKRPGDQIDVSGDKTAHVLARVRVRSDVAPVQHVQIIGNGRELAKLDIPPGLGQGHWIELEANIQATESMWIAARAYSTSVLGTPDAESHTNPVYVIANRQAPYQQASLDRLLLALDQQILKHKQRSFPQQAQVIAYFERSRDILARLREAKGCSVDTHPAELASDLPDIADPGARAHNQQELREFLQPIPAKPIADVLASFDTVGKFEMQLIAQEPLVADPIAAAIDEDGNMYVCEMRDYPFKPKAGEMPIGRVRMLRDVDGDGDYDESHIFADHLLWAGGVACWKGGIFVAAPPDIWYFKDTNGDHQADLRQKIYTGFGSDNQQAMVNNLQWGLDHKIYGATAGNGGSIQVLRKPGQVDLVNSPSQEQDAATPIAIQGRDFRFDPETGEFETVSGTVQFGNTFDDWGNRFVCSESQPIEQILLPEHYLVRNRFLPVPSAIANLAPGPVPIFRTSPIERWRMIRSSRRIAHGNRSALSAGASHHVVDAAAGVTIYRGGAYPSEYYGDVFVGDAQNNLVHHRELDNHTLPFTSVRSEEGTDFVRSSDNWFRPVNFVNAPDGTLYVLDMSREILESIHVPLDVAQFLNFTNGRDHGRIYRLAPPAFQYPGTPTLSAATTEELVAALSSVHGWYRDTAHRLLHERQDRRAVGPLRDVLLSSGLPQARLLALYGLAGLAALTEDDLIHASHDENPWVRKHAWALAESFLPQSPALQQRLLASVQDSNPHVRMQVAFSLGVLHDSSTEDGLVALAQAWGEDAWMRAAILSSAVDVAAPLLLRFWDCDARERDQPVSEMERDLLLIVAAKHDANELVQLLEGMAARRAKLDASGRRSEYLDLLARGLLSHGIRVDSLAGLSLAARAMLADDQRTALRISRDAKGDLAERLENIQRLAYASDPESISILHGLLQPSEAESVRLAAMGALSQGDSHELHAKLVEQWDSLSPALAQKALDYLLDSQQGMEMFLTAVREGKISAAILNGATRAALLGHSDEHVRQLAGELLRDPTESDRVSVIDRYRRAQGGETDLARGAAVFQRECQMCHKLGEVGYAVGPNLSSSAARDPDALLTHILDPNRYVDPRYITYSATDRAGRVFSGIVTHQSATSVTLMREEGRANTILRTDLDELASTRLSLMPEGFEQRIDVSQMQDLIRFLQAQQESTEAPLDIGTVPGLTEIGAPSP